MKKFRLVLVSLIIIGTFLWIPNTSNAYKKPKKENIKKELTKRYFDSVMGGKYHFKDFYYFKIFKKKDNEYIIYFCGTKQFLEADKEKKDCKRARLRIMRDGTHIYTSVPNDTQILMKKKE